ncbi:hypothetical protein H6F88_18925 [Oculatella sp. FACHB-28]|nr:MULTISPECIES: hypothetical protein [Cyanophyceae]MBD2000332.1 hypothetical protein [Leptolyngbya sp. FACHB-541]MBD2058061.1 hypothetical protein [Oculatella sp. FACHB-28]MBD2068406.1 hypothetical protein [Leptolyngbya sp. FACHB-671]
MHESPKKAWTVASLAKQMPLAEQMPMSRSHSLARFTELVRIALSA